MTQTASVAQTILDQIGGNRFLAMTGAKNLLNIETGLQFDLPRGLAKNKATKVRVSLEPGDLYALEFFTWNARALTCKPVGKVAGIFAEDLRASFTHATGLDCTL